MQSAAGETCWSHFQFIPVCSGPQYASSNLRHLQDLPSPLMQQLTSTAQAHSTLCVTPRDTNSTSLEWRQRLLRHSLMSRWSPKKFSTKLIYPLEWNVETSHMPKAIYYFNIPPWLDEVGMLIFIALLHPGCLTQVL